MNFMNKMERKFGRYAIPNLTLFIIGGYVIGYIFLMFNAKVMDMLTLNPYYILKGQIWRVFTWVLVPPGRLGIFTIIMLFFYYSLGTNLERNWGSFRYNVYILGGMLMTVIGSFLLYFVYQYFIFGTKEVTELLDLVYGTNIDEMGVRLSFDRSVVLRYAYDAIFNEFSTYYINLSIFLAFAASYPDMQVLLYFVIPVKIKWMAYLDVAFLLYAVYQYARAGVLGIGGIVAIVVSLLNFVIFFAMTRNYRRISPKEVHRRNAYKKQVHRANDQRITTHRCAVCGQTDQDNPELEFRFCSKCNGNYEYCQNHLFTHQHVQ